MFKVLAEKCNRIAIARRIEISHNSNSHKSRQVL